jgi:1-acyl-sn-glycerol-3-phosphate acyltransferase
MTVNADDAPAGIDYGAIAPRVPPQAPQFKPTVFARLVLAGLRLSGWRITGTLPDVPKLVVIAAPHSSNWDGVLGLAFKIALRLDFRFIIKQEWAAGPFGRWIRALGGIGIDRKAAHDVVAQMRRAFAERDKLWLGITPEGTRKKVNKWKSGFWHIARAAHVPILPIYFHYPDKTIGLLPLFTPGDDLDADMAQIRALYLPYQGKNRGSV